MRRRDYHRLVGDIRRIRPCVIVALTVITLLPSFDAMATQGLSALTVLFRLAVNLAIVGALVWLVSAVVLHYARIQLEGPSGQDHQSGSHA